MSDERYVLVQDRKMVCIDLHFRSMLSFDQAEALRREREFLKGGKLLTIYKVDDSEVQQDDICIMVDDDKLRMIAVVKGSSPMAKDPACKRLQPLGSLF